MFFISKRPTKAGYTPSRCRIYRVNIGGFFDLHPLILPASSFWYIYKMKANKSHHSGLGIAIGSAIGVAIGFALGKNSTNSSQFIALGLAIGTAVGSVIDFRNRKK